MDRCGVPSRPEVWETFLLPLAATSACPTAAALKLYSTLLTRSRTCNLVLFDLVYNSYYLISLLLHRYKYRDSNSVIIAPYFRGRQTTTPLNQEKPLKHTLNNYQEALGHVSVVYVEGFLVVVYCMFYNVPDGGIPDVASQLQFTKHNMV